MYSHSRVIRGSEISMIGEGILIDGNIKEENLCERH